MSVSIMPMEWGLAIVNFLKANICILRLLPTMKEIFNHYRFCSQLRQNGLYSEPIYFNAMQ